MIHILNELSSAQWSMIGNVALFYLGLFTFFAVCPYAAEFCRRNKRKLQRMRRAADAKLEDHMGQSGHVSRSEVGRVNSI